MFNAGARRSGMMDNLERQGKVMFRKDGLLRQIFPKSMSIFYSLTTLSLMLLLTPVLPPIVALQWYDPSVSAVTLKENSTGWSPSGSVSVSTGSFPSLTSQ